MTSHWTRARDADLATVLQARVWAALCVVALAFPVAVAHASEPVKPGSAQGPRPLVMGLTCDGSAAPVEELHSWDPRVPMGGAPEQCLDGKAKLRLTPNHVDLRYNRVTEHLEVVLTISEADGHAIGDFFARALKTGTRHVLILVYGKVLVHSAVVGQFSGTTFEIDVGSDEGAKAIAAVLTGP